MFVLSFWNGNDDWNISLYPPFDGKISKEGGVAWLQIGPCNVPRYDVAIACNGRGILRQHIKFAPSVLLHAPDKSL